jgi:hypothetical protein
LTIAYKRELADLGGHPLAADIYLNLIAYRNTLGESTKADRYTHGRGHRAAGDFAQALGSAHCHMGAHDTTVQKLQANKSPRI